MWGTSRFVRFKKWSWSGWLCPLQLIANIIQRFHFIEAWQWASILYIFCNETFKNKTNSDTLGLDTVLFYNLLTFEWRMCKNAALCFCYGRSIPHVVHTINTYCILYIFFKRKQPRHLKKQCRSYLTTFHKPYQWGKQD